MKQELYEINKREYYLVALICFALMTIFHDLATFLVVWIVSGAVALFMAKFINLKQQKNKR